MLTDELWVVLEPLDIAAKRHRGGQQPVLPDRLFFEALLDLGRTGIPLRDLPDEFGDWRAVYQRLRRWVLSGAMRRLFECMTANPEFQEVRRVLVDSTTVRAHRDAARARREKKKIGAARSAANEGLGRSRGGLTTKIMMTAVDESTPIEIDVVTGSRHDAPLLPPILATTSLIAWERSAKSWGTRASTATRSVKRVAIMTQSR